MVQRIGYEGGDFQIGITRTENGGFRAPLMAFGDLVAGTVDHIDPSSFEDRFLNTIDSRRGSARPRRRRKVNANAAPARYQRAPALPRKRYISPTEVPGVVYSHGYDDPNDPFLLAGFGVPGSSSLVSPETLAHVANAMDDSSPTATLVLVSHQPSSTKKRRRRRRNRRRKGKGQKAKVEATATDVPVSASPVPVASRKLEPTKKHRQKANRRRRNREYRKRKGEQQAKPAQERSKHLNRDGSVDREKLYEQFPSLRRFAR
jgi:hypothetical protein